MANWLQKFRDPIYWYFLVLIIAIPSGWFFHAQLAPLADYSTLILGGIFFLGALKIGKEDIERVWHSKITIGIFDLLMLIGLPVFVYLIALILVPDYALPLLILAAMPTGMSTPLLAGIVGGRESLAMAMTVTTSLLAPFTVPLIIHALVGVNVDVNFWQMFISIAEIIFIPFILVWIIRRFIPKISDNAKVGFGRTSIVLLGLLMAGVVAQQSSAIIESFLSSEFIISLLVVTTLMAFFYFLGYVLYAKKSGQDRITLTVSFANMNFTLAIFLAHKYFTDPKIVVPITLAVVPWFVFIVLFKYITYKFNNDVKKQA